MIMKFFESCPPEQTKVAETLYGIIASEGFELVPLPTIDISYRVQMQRGDRIFAREAILFPAALANAPVADLALSMLQKFADIAKQHPQAVTAQSA